MKLIFKSITGIIFVSGLFLIIGSLIALYVPQLEPVVRVVKGFVFIIVLMGTTVIAKSGFDLIFREGSEE